MIVKFVSLLGLVALLPQSVHAHTRWFAESELSPLTVTEPTTLYLLVWASIIILITSVGILFERKHILCLHFLKPKQPHAFERAASTFTMVAGTFFVIAGSHEYLFSPNLTPAAGVPYFLIVLQIVIGLAFLLGIATRLAALGLIATWSVLMLYIDTILVIENIWILSTAIFILFMGNDYFSLLRIVSLRKRFSPFKRYALSCLRIGTGATLMILGVSEKITAPELGINFLVLHDWNFMSMLGFPYSDYLFTLSAGSVEFLFGLIFVLGVATRFNALVAAIVFTVPLFILGPIELAGHLPHFAAMVLLLIFGNGGHFLPFSKRHPRS